MENYSIAYFCLITFPRDIHHIPINNRKSWHAFFDLLASSLFNLGLLIILMHIQGVPKKFLKSGAQKTPIWDPFTLCAGCSHIGFSFLS